MKALDRSVEMLGLWIVTSSVTFIKSANQCSFKLCLIVHLVAVWTLIYNIFLVPLFSLSDSQQSEMHLRRLAFGEHYQPCFQRCSNYWGAGLCLVFIFIRLCRPHCLFGSCMVLSGLASVVRNFLFSCRRCLRILHSSWNWENTPPGCCSNRREAEDNEWDHLWYPHSKNVRLGMEL